MTAERRLVLSDGSLVETDLDSQIDISADVQCIGVTYRNLITGEENPGTCPNPAKWTRNTHCSTYRKDMYCPECKKTMDYLASIGCARCCVCLALISPGELLWYRL